MDAGRASCCCACIDAATPMTVSHRHHAPSTDKTAAEMPRETTWIRGVAKKPAAPALDQGSTCYTASSAAGCNGLWARRSAEVRKCGSAGRHRAGAHCGTRVAAAATAAAAFTREESQTDAALAWVQKRRMAMGRATRRVARCCWMRHGIRTAYTSSFRKCPEYNFVRVCRSRRRQWAERGAAGCPAAFRRRQQLQQPGQGGRRAVLQRRVRDRRPALSRLRARECLSCIAAAYYGSPYPFLIHQRVRYRRPPSVSGQVSASNFSAHNLVAESRHCR